ncbi:ATP-dependent RNA helicase SUPV3L1/SUV3 [Rhodoligotrophos appendicifer]|uniref:helicase-related protein n=1 Tax=Rhodoligotrophos appendicifer TaxID=987056 RepID=UPI00117DB708|nr:helicase-related protein [Rhodoligotrophos appendicifer]
MKTITAVLGPTNTGKTHLAVERMLGYETGMIGLPLRLLAREVYDKVRAKVGEQAVALVTGEEKIVPSSPRFWVCTVEAMPPELQVDFLAIDEVQLAADLDRGHIFTDRILHRRGSQETMLLGSSTMRPMIERLLPGTNYITRPRFSKLSFSGSKKITRLPPRSAVVAFSADQVYSIAELIRRQRGGAAVVLGALSPRTRNAQVALYESGDVDFLVATDAIGMGLNMDVDHIAFAQARKFDGFNFRDLTPAELAQIAGRAGRHMNDGTFGVTGEVDPFSREIIDRIENHNFESIKYIQWRNRELDFSTVESLMRSLAEAPSIAGLMRAQSGADQLALEQLANDPDVRNAAKGREAVTKLWEVCQIPDYRNITGNEHANLVGRVYGFLTSAEGKIPADWFEGQLKQADNVEGDIDTLATRIAHVRTWTFIANRSDWLEDADGWREKARATEDRLSDALHERLSQRFIDRRTSVLMKRLREKDRLASSVDTGGEILVEGVFVGQIKGFHFIPDTSSDASEGRTLRAASMQAVAAEIADRAKQLVEDRVEVFALGREGSIRWRDTRIARLVAGRSVLKPQVELIADEQLSGADREAVQKRLEQFVEYRIGEVLKPLVQLESAQDLEGLARGLAFRLVEQLGVLSREEVKDDVKQLDQAARAGLRNYGIRFGAFNIFMPLLLKPAAMELKLLLWALTEQQAGRLDLDKLPEPPTQGLTSVAFDQSTPKGFYRAVGFRVCGTRAVRIDMLERLADVIRPRVFWRPQFDGDTRPNGSVEGGGFTVVPDMMSLVGCSGEEFASILRTLGFRCENRVIEPSPPEVPETAASSETPLPDEAPVAEQFGSEAITEAPAELLAEAPAEILAENGEGAEPSAVEATPNAAPEQGEAENADGETKPETPAAATAIEGDVTPSAVEAHQEPEGIESSPPAAASDAGVVDPSVDAPIDVPAKPLEPTVLEVWWPKDAGPFKRAEGGGRRDARRQQQERPGAEKRAGGAHPRQEGDRPREARGPRPERNRNDPSRHEKPRHEGGRPEKPRHERPDKPRQDERHAARQRREESVRADSPFAVLGALKAELLQKRKTGQ